MPLTKELTVDGFLGEKLSVLQPQKGYRAGIDAVMLAASIPAQAGEQVLDLGAGVGVVSLCLARRCHETEVIGLEIQSDLARTANENAQRNGLSARVRFVEGSAAEKASALELKKVPYGSFHHVMTNPPFYEAGKVWNSPDAGKATAHAFDDFDLKNWVHVACAMARPKGTVTFVHRADALPDLLKHIDGRLGDLLAFPLWSRQGQSASRVVLQGVKGSRAPFTLGSGLTLHKEDGGFTSQASEILRDGAELSLGRA
jgi:tRNA1(Val) A37 N6-methylase TrmN6